MELGPVDGQTIHLEGLVPAEFGMNQFGRPGGKRRDPVMMTHQDGKGLGQVVEDGVLRGGGGHLGHVHADFSLRRIMDDVTTEGTSDELMSPAGSQERDFQIDQSLHVIDQPGGEGIVVHHGVRTGTADHHGVRRLIAFRRHAIDRRDVDRVELGQIQARHLEYALTLVDRGDLLGTDLDEQDFQVAESFGHVEMVSGVTRQPYDGATNLGRTGFMSEFERLAFQTNDGAKLNLLTSGSGRPLVMIPGWSQTAAMYKEQLQGLKGDCRVIAMDPRGHGDSENVTWGYTIQRLAMDLREVLVAFELENVALMGHSMGNSVMWAYLQMFGEERLERLIIVDEPTMLTINPAWTEEERLQKGAMFTSEQLWQSCNDLAGSDGDQVTDAFVRNLLSPMIDEADQQWIVRENLKMPRSAASALLYNHGSQDWTETIKRIRLPTLVFAGRGSKSPWQGQQWIHQQIPGSEFCLLEEDEGGHHFMFLENPIRFNQAVRSFLA